MGFSATTESGKAYIKHGWDACSAVERHIIEGKISVNIFGFPDEEPSRMDAIMVDRATKRIFGTLEIKSRNLTEEAFSKRYNMELLVSFDKLQNSYWVVNRFRVPHWLMIYCIPSGVAFLKKVFTLGNGRDFRPLVESNFRTKTEMSLVTHASSEHREEALSYVDMRGAERVHVKRNELPF